MKLRLFCAYCLFVFLAEETTSQTIVQSIPLPNTTYWNQAYDLTPAGSTNLHIVSSTSSSVYNLGFVYTMDTLTNRLDSLVTGLGQCQGIASDDSTFYYIRRYTSTCTIMRLRRNGSLIDSLRFTSPTRLIGGAVWDGSHLWVSDYTPTPSTGRPAVLLKIDWATKTFVDSIITIGLQPTGVAWDGQYIYYAMDMLGSEPNLNLIYVVDPVTRDTVRTIPMPEARTVDSNPRGLVWDGRHLWLIARPVGGGTGQVLYKYDLSGSGTPAISVPVRFFDYGRVRIGNTRQVEASILNIGTADLRVDSLRILFSGQFTTNLTTPLTIPPGSNSIFTITYTPTTYGIDSAHVVLYHNDPARQPQVVRNVAMGIYPSAHISLPVSYDYGVRRVNSTNPRIFRVENRGATPLRVDSVSFSTSPFSVEQGALPFTVDSINSRDLRVWFRPPASGTFTDTMRIFSNASNAPQMPVFLTGSGEVVSAAIGVPLWTYTVANHPISNSFRLVKAVRMINDITGDGFPEVIVSTENYWTMAVNGNSSVSNDSLWAFTTYIHNASAGSIGSTGSYSHQKALAIASDLNGDGYNDVVIGTGGGNERVYAINGRNGQMLWSFGTDHPDSFSLGDFDGIDASTDFNNDGIPDVIAAAGATEVGGLGGRRTIYLFNGVNGSILWQSPLLGFTHAVSAIADINNDGVPDVIGTVGEPTYKGTAFSGANGSIIWDFPVPSGSGGGKEVMVLPVRDQVPDVILGAFWGPVYRINGATGAQRWIYTTGSGGGVMQIARLRDVTGDGVDEILLALLGGGARCLNGETGSVIWSLPTGNTMGITSVPDLNQDGFDDVAIAVQSQGALIVRGQNGQQLGLYSTSPNQGREIAAVADFDGNGSVEMVIGGNTGVVALVSGGLDAMPVGAENGDNLPGEFSVSQNYPNPFNPSTTIQIRLPSREDVRVRIFDILGREVRVFEYERVPPGVHSIVWDGTNVHGASVASGVYFYQVRAGDKMTVRRMLMVK